MKTVKCYKVEETDAVRAIERAKKDGTTLSAAIREFVIRYGKSRKFLFWRS